MSAEHHTSAEIFWQAFRYAGDEMTVAEREDFETILAADQPAREAVARVVELESLVRTVEGGPIEVGSLLLSVQRDYWFQPLGWVAVGAAACLATVMAFQTLWPATGAAPSAPQVAVGGSSAGSDAAGSNNSVDGELALAWARAQAELPAPDDSSPAGLAAIGGDAVLDETAEHDLASVTDDQVAAAPSWLLAAVADAEGSHVEN